MAERIVSPGVFTREKDLSFLPQGIAEIGASIIGPTKKGPAFVPSVVRNFNDFKEMFGGLSQDLYVPFTVREYLRSAGTVTIVRVLGLGGYKVSSVHIAAHTSASTDFQTLAVLAPSATDSDGNPGGFDGAIVEGTLNSFSVESGSFQVSCSLNPSNSNYIENLFSSNPLSTKANGKSSPFYLYKVFKNAASSHGSGSAKVSASITDIDLNQDYQNAYSPYITSQKVDGATANLWKFYMRSHGDDETHGKYKAGILNIKQAGTVAGSDWGSFSIQVRELDSQTYKESDDTIVEQWDNLNLDPNSANYFARRIGDRWVSIDSDGKITYNGSWPNHSKIIYVEPHVDVKGGGVSSNVPFGHGKLISSFVTGSQANGAVQFSMIPASYTSEQVNNNTGEFDTTAFYGFDFSSPDNRQYLAPVDNSAKSYTNATFSLNDQLGHADAKAADFGGSTTFAGLDVKLALGTSNVAQHKFTVPFQGGFDGSNPANTKNTAGDISATNQQGFDCSTSDASGSKAYKMALNAVSNQDEFDINLLATPGLIYTLHPNPINHGMDMVKRRGDAFYVFDPSAWGDGISNATAAIENTDTNYAACYYPWVKVLDDSINLPTWVPPSVVIPGVFSQNDRVAHEWFAPAGLNRGGLTNVLEAKTRLTHAERDLLYEARVNPIASFPGQGVVVFGQKTLQAKPSALDRINVRRMLIRIKKFIASSSRYLLFENNTVATRNRFLNIVNPYLDSVQSNQGLTAFRVVMDDTNNTPDVIDRNQLVGQIYLQPARSVEFIVLDFVVQPTGATFPS
jgi:phage tail sheath protein FI